MQDDTAAGVRRWLSTAVALLGEHREALDRANVFPVADSDTGTNLLLTVTEAADAADAAADVADIPAVVARAAVRGSLVGARGNSGVIVSQYLAALLATDAAGDLPAMVDAAASVGALDRAAVSARRAVARPVEGTVLTVARAVADGAAAGLATGARDSRGAVLRVGLEAGWRALAETPDQLPVLREAGVVDAGAWGLLLVLEALAEVLTGEAGPRREVPTNPAAVAVAPAASGGAFEVMYVVDDPTADVSARLRGALVRIGDSVAVVGAEGLRQAHVHTDTPLAALDAARALGVEPVQVRVRFLHGEHAGAHPHGVTPSELGLVAVTAAPGLVADLARAGAVVVLMAPGRVAGPELGRAVADAAADRVLLLAAAGLVDGDRLARRRGPSVVTARTGLAEVQIAAAGAVWAAHDDDPGEARLRRVLDALAEVRVERPGPGGVVPAAKVALARGAGLLTVLTGPDADLTEAGLAAALGADLAAAHAELLVLPGVLTGAEVELGIE